MSAWTLPAKLYADAGAFERELSCLFRRSWLLFGPTHGRLGAVGSAWAQTVVPGTPLIATRTKSGVKMYSNVCRHRAGPLLFDGVHTQGTKNLLTCRYHRWCYSAETGGLISAPHFGDPALPKENMGLHAVGAVKEKLGLLFYRMDEEGEPFEDVYGDLWERLSTLAPIDTFEFLGTRSHRLQCNWKTYVENYSEGYHITAVHSGLSNAFDTTTYKVIPHEKYRYVEHRVEEVKGAAANPYVGLWFYLWPNLALNVYRHGMTVEQIIPHSVDTTEIRYTDLIHRDATAEQIELLRGGSDDVTKEDIQICEAVQLGLKSGQYHRGRLSPLHENGVEWFQRQYTHRFLEKFNDIHDPCYNRGSAAH